MALVCCWQWTIYTQWVYYVRWSLNVCFDSNRRRLIFETKKNYMASELDSDL